MYTRRLISFFEALCLLINYQIKAVLFSDSVFFTFSSCNLLWVSQRVLHEHWITPISSGSRYSWSALCTREQKYQLSWREQWGLQQHPHWEAQDEHKTICIFFQLAEETTCHIFSWQISVQLHCLLIDWLQANSADPGDVIPYNEK